MTNISVTDDVKEKLLKIASELQIRLRRRVDLNEAIRFLISEGEKGRTYWKRLASPYVELKRRLKSYMWRGNSMKRDLSGRLVLDTSALIELIFSTSTGLKLKKALIDGRLRQVFT